MGNNMGTLQWYADNAGTDKYVSCIAAMMDEMRKQGVAVGRDWLERVVVIRPKKQWSNRRLFWYLSVKLRYAEWKKSEDTANSILSNVRKKITSERDFYTRRMFKTLETDCFIILHKITSGRIQPLFKNYHRLMLSTIDDFMMIDQSTIVHRAFVEDSTRLFDVANDIEALCGSFLYQSVDTVKIQATGSGTLEALTSQIIPFQPVEDNKTTTILNYLSHWSDIDYDTQSPNLMKMLLGYIENAKVYVDKNLGVKSETLFSSVSKEDKCIKVKVARARIRMIKELKQRGISAKKKSFWKLYIEVVIQRAIDCMGENVILNEKNEMALRQAARWPLHEKMHRVINSLACDPAYLQHLLQKKIINSESLLYGIFARLSMKSVAVVYCGFNIIRDDNEIPSFERHCHNGTGNERVYSELAERAYEISHDQIGSGFCISLSKNTGMNLKMDIGCVCTNDQIIIIGISKNFKLNNQNIYHSGKQVLGELFELVGFHFLKNMMIKIEGPKSPETSAQRFKHASLKPRNSEKNDHFISHFIEHEIACGSIQKIPELEAMYFDHGYFDEMIEAVRL